MPSPDEGRIIAELANHPAWTALRSVVREKMEKQFHLFATDLMQGKQPSVEEVHYARGFFAGMKYLLDQPKLADAEIARELAKYQDEGRKGVKLDA